MNNIVLAIIYNHRYDKNISILEDLYKERFTNIYHIVPFYDGDLENVIPVYESSFYFSGYVSQAYTHLKKMDFSHFFFVADDMLIKPEINETTLFETIGINEDESYIDEIKTLTSREKYWPHLYSALCYNPNQQGVEIIKILPGKDVARSRIISSGYNIEALPLFSYLLYLFKKIAADLFFAFKRKRLKRFLGGEKEFPSRKFRYPLVGGYSDIFIVPSINMPEFAKYCGAFAASNLFVEIALPTALVLASPKIKTNKDIRLRSGAMWSKTEKVMFANKYNSDFVSLLKNFPVDKLYIHPVKLSQWRLSDSCKTDSKGN